VRRLRMAHPVARLEKFVHLRRSRARAGGGGVSAPGEGFDLGAAICSRICHDLISPVGAVGNGVELMRELGAAAGPELDLIEQSAETAAATLAFHRIAFGAARVEDRMALEAVRRTALRWFATQRARLAWPPAEGEASRPAARLICGLLLCAASCLPRGGEARLIAAGGGGKIAVAAAGEGAGAPADAAAWLADDPSAPPPGPRDVHWLATGRHARLAGAAAAIEAAPGRIVLRAAPA